MSTRGFNLIVVLMWLATMIWLVEREILPDLLVGTPPSYPQVLRARARSRMVGWDILCDGEGVGWAVNSIVWQQNPGVRQPVTEPSEVGLGLDGDALQSDRLATIQTFVRFNNFPLLKLLPKGLPELLGLKDSGPGCIAFTSVSEFAFDSLGQLTRLASSLRFDPSFDPLKVTAEFNEGYLEGTVQQGMKTQNFKVPASRQSILADTLSPQTDLPGLRDGQYWTVEVYSPMQTPTMALGASGKESPPREILHAKVEGRELVPWDSGTVSAWAVVYRGDSTAGRASERGKVWVLEDGKVIRQQVHLFDCVLTFQRTSESLANKYADDARREMTTPLGRVMQP
jgi:hypothetical protein